MNNMYNKVNGAHGSPVASKNVIREIQPIGFKRQTMFITQFYAWWIQHQNMKKNVNTHPSWEINTYTSYVPSTTKGKRFHAELVAKYDKN